MKNCLLTFLFALSLISCTSEDDEIDCSVIDIAPQLFFIEYLDEDGNNLLDNGTYVPEEIEVTLDDVAMGEVYTHTEESFLIIYEYGGLQNNESDYIIKLSSTETDIMQLEYSQKAGICGTHIFTVERAVYNNVEMDLENYMGNEKITVIKPK
jgi:hypothetical protein